MADITRLEGYAFAKKKDGKITIFEGPRAEAGNLVVTSEGSDTGRTLKDRFADVVNVKDFGAVGDGETDDTGSVSTMVEAVGYVRFPRGQFRLGSCTIDAPAYFDAGAELYAASGATVEFTHSIIAPPQFIFRGDGEYSLGNDEDSGEQAREVHVAWFGAFPQAEDVETDQAPRIQAAIDAVNRSSRESVIKFDIGNYVIGSQVTLGRACHILGAGIRRTVFRYPGHDYIMFYAGTTGCRFSHVQFEPIEYTGETVRTEPCIVLNGDYCQIWDAVMHVNAECAIFVDAGGTFSDIRDIRAVCDSGAGIFDGDLIRISAGKVRVQGVTCNSSVGFSTLVHVVGSSTTYVSGLTIRDVTSVLPSTAVKVTLPSGAVNMTGLVVQNVQVLPGSDWDGPSVLVENKGEAGIYYLRIDGVTQNRATPVVKLVCEGSGPLSDIHVDNVCVGADTSDAITIENKGAGTINRITIGSGADNSTGAAYANVSGAATVYDAGRVPLGSVSPFSFYSSVNAGSVWEIDLGRAIYAGSVIVSSNRTDYNGLFVFRAASSPFVAALAGTGIDVATGELTGETGADGMATLSAGASGEVYLENRTSSSISFGVTFLSLSR